MGAKGMLLALVLVACGHGRWEAIDAASLPRAADYPGKPAAVLLDATRIRFALVSGRAVAEVTHRHREIVFNPAVYTSPAVTEHWALGFTEVVSIRARTIHDGIVEEVDPAKATDVPVLDALEYSDERIRSLALPPVPAGGIVEWETTTRELQPGLFHFAASFGGELAVRRALLEVIAPADWRIEWLARALGEPLQFPPATETKDGQARWTWERRDLPALEPEPWGPAARDEREQVMVRLAAWKERGAEVHAFAGARDVSAWVSDLSAPALTVTPEMKAAVATMIAGAGEDPVERAKRLYRFVTENVQYFAIELGSGRYQPHAADEVFRVRYGDCKDKANLLRALLSAAGVQSHLALLYAHDGWPEPFALPVLSNFNHEIVVLDLPGGKVIADPTTRTVPFGELPPSDREADLLPVVPGGAELVRTPPDDPSLNAVELIGALRIGADGAGAGKVALHARGHLSSELRFALLGAAGKERTRVLANAVGLANARVAESAGEEDVITAELQVPGIVRGGGRTRLVRLSDFAPSPAPALPAGPRRTPFVSAQRMTLAVDLSLELPAGLTASPPPPVRLESPFGTETLEWESAPGRLRVRRTFVLRERIVAASRFAELRAFFDAARAAESRAVLLHEQEAP